MEIPVVILTIWHSVVLTEATCYTMKSECLQILFKNLVAVELYLFNILFVTVNPFHIGRNVGILLLSRCIIHKKMHTIMS